mmetsp:Transcript_1189/g.3209  ORF Transcript_1189/g.3209 Transcript_1189/m.3209 type:complete len:244 (+) Transcript_1189:846-1577(+)
MNAASSSLILRQKLACRWAELTINADRRRYTSTRTRPPSLSLTERRSCRPCQKVSRKSRTSANFANQLETTSSRASLSAALPRHHPMNTAAHAASRRPRRAITPRGGGSSSSSSSSAAALSAAGSSSSPASRKCSSFRIPLLHHKQSNARAIVSRMTWMPQSAQNRATGQLLNQSPFSISRTASAFRRVAWEHSKDAAKPRQMAPNSVRCLVAHTKRPSALSGSPCCLVDKPSVAQYLRAVSQ